MTTEQKFLFPLAALVYAAVLVVLLLDLFVWRPN